MDSVAQKVESGHYIAPDVPVLDDSYRFQRLAAKIMPTLLCQGWLWGDDPSSPHVRHMYPQRSSLAYVIQYLHIHTIVNQAFPVCSTPSTWPAYSHGIITCLFSGSLFSIFDYYCLLRPALQQYPILIFSIPLALMMRCLSEKGGCKVRYCGKFVSEVKINDTPVNKEWVEYPVGARLKLLASTAQVMII